MINETEALRLEYLAEVQDELTQNEPGSFGCHELLDRTHLLVEMVERQVASHAACVQNPEWFALANQAMTALNELYQAVGAEHLAVSEKPQTNGQASKRVKMAS